LAPRDRGWLESLRLSLEIADVGYGRLVEGLLGMTTEGPLDLGKGPVARAFADAWSMVDATWQVHELLCRPAITVQSASADKPAVQVSAFKKAVKHLQSVRNKGQHRDVHGPNAVEAGIPVWGTLRWSRVDDGSPQAFKTCVLTVDSTNSSTHDFINPLGKPIIGPIDRVQLCAFGETVDLSEIVVKLQEHANEWDAVLAPQFKNCPRGQPAMLVVVGGVIDPPSVEHPEL
jgi:hypothetical protein